MKTIVATFLVASFCFQLEAQSFSTVETDRKSNSLYLELFGNGIGYSLNYERKINFPKKERVSVGLRVGYSYFQYNFFGRRTFSTIPTEVLFLYGKKFCIETGIGYAFNFADEWYNVSFRLGFRYQAPEGLIIRLAPLYLYYIDYEYDSNNSAGIGYFGISIGYSF